jgi:hypothetical protein
MVKNPRNKKIWTAIFSTMTKKFRVSRWREHQKNFKMAAAARGLTCNFRGGEAAGQAAARLTLLGLNLKTGMMRGALYSRQTTNRSGSRCHGVHGHCIPVCLPLPSLYPWLLLSSSRHFLPPPYSFYPTGSWRIVCLPCQASMTSRLPAASQRGTSGGSRSRGSSGMPFVRVLIKL